MRRLLLSILLITASIVTIGAANLTSNDPYWIGADPTFGTTEGNDFWLTFMNNAMFDPSSPLNANITFELKVAISARQQTRVFVEVGSTVITVDVSPNTTEIVDLSDLYATIYLLNSEVTNQYKGIHVYTLEPNKSFSCFNYSRNGEAGESSRDATLIIPTRFMGKEYFVQTYYEDNFSSEFAIVATDSNTVVHIWPAYATAGGSAANSEIVVPLNEPGDAYLLASAPHQGNFIKVDLSGSKICSNKPIAVFNGNQQTSIPYHEANSKDYLSEQILPLSQWGTDFYLAQMGGTKKNYFIITAAYPNTEVVINSYITSDNDTVSETINLVNAGDTYTPYDLSNEYPEVTIHSDKPIMCYVYSTSAGSNEYCTGSGRNKICYYYGDPANALMPSWAHRTTSMNFFTHQLDPFIEEDKPEPPQKFYVFLVAKWDDRNAITVDGATHAADFHQFRGDQTMAYASIEIMDGPNPADKYHVVESTGDGFVGVVYGLTDAQGYLYTLGYTPDPFRDSLFVENPENIMVAGYDLPRIEQGWYQRQWDEWAKGHERLDTAQVCDSTVVQWMVQTPITKGKTPVEWKIYDVTNGAKPGDATLIEGFPTEQATPTRTTETDWIYQFEHQFVLPDESALPPEQRIPFKEYEIHAVLHQAHQICPDIPAETDTLKTTVRVTRIYHDTIYQYICMGDSYEFFNDSLPNQGDLSQKADTKSPTTFIGDKTDGESTTDFEWKARLGENIFDRAYQTIYGCDSTYTLFLFVCDTFRRVDTVHLCDNQSVEYETEKFKGILAPDIDGTIVTKDSVAIIYDKTRYCPCQENPKYPAFQGCDSIFELHIMLHKTYRDTLVDTMCYNDKPDSLYRWPIQYSARDSLIGKNHPNMVYYDNLQAWVGYFSDTLQTQTCPECNEGKGCDSINILKLIIPKSYYDEQQDSICQWDYDKTTRTKITNVYRWYHHRNGADYVELPESGVYYDSCLTRYGCDSVYTLELKYLEPFLQVDKHVMATNQTYKWHGVTYGPYLEEEFKNLADGDTILYFHNDNENQVHPVNGCDSIYRLELTLMDTYLFKTYRTICDNDSVHWRDTVIVGSEWEGSDPYDIRLTKTYTTVFDSLKTVELPERDSVYQLTVTMWPNYAQYDTLYVCDNDSVEWEGQWYKGADGALDDERHYPTKHDCDSAFYLHLLVKPSYHFAVEDSAVCQNEPFVWTQHTQITIPTDVAGEFYYYDSCLTTTCPLCEGGGCDSIYTLRLTVHPVYDIYEEHTICSSDSLHWQGMLFTGDEFANYGGTYDATAFRRVTTNLPAGEHNDTAWYHTTGYGCDSIYHLTLTVLPVYRTEIERRACQDELTYHYEYLNNGLGGDLPAAHLSDSLTRNDTIQALNGCDSIITLHFYVDSVYKYTQDAGFVCQEIGGTWEWRNSFGDLLGTVSLDKGDSLVVLGERYTTVHGCDSAFGVELYIAPIHDIYEERTICANDSLHWQGMLFTGDEFANYGGTYDATAFRRVTTNLPAGEHTDTAWYHTTGYGCDSIRHLTLTVLPVGRETIERRACQSEGTYYYKHMNNGAGGYLPAAHLSDSLKRIDTIQTALGCDSIVTLHYYVDSVYNYTSRQVICQEYGTDWIWYENGVPQDTISLDKGDTTYILGRIYTTIHGCDSMYGKSLYVAPIYHIYDTATLCSNDSLHWQGMLFTGNEYDNYGKTYIASDFDSVKLNLSASEYDYAIRRGTSAYDCDSVHHLHLTVNAVGRETIERRACQSKGTYYYEHLNNGAGGYLPAAHLSDALTRNDTIQTALGCDSIVTLHYYVDSVYNYTSRQVICQEYGTDWIWYENGVPQDTISLDKGDTTYVLGRSYTTIHGCDSTYGKSVYVVPIYHFYDTLNLCENDSLHWQGMLFTGSQYTAYGKSYDASAFDSVRADVMHGTYQVDINRPTIHSCDSTYHLTLFVHEVARTDSVDSICQGTPFFNPNWNWGQGRYMNTGRVGTYTSVDTIHSAVTGCDSIVTLTLRVDSVYDYNIRYTFCQDTIDTMREWIDEEGKSHGWVLDISQPGDFRIDRLFTTIHGCDSTYGVTWHVDPIYRFDTIIDMCENSRIEWQNTRFTGDSVHDITAEDSVIRTPGTYYEFRHYETVAGCDSDYYATIHVHAVYDTLTLVEICESEGFIWYQNDYSGLGPFADTVCHVSHGDTVRLLPSEAVFPQQARDITVRSFERMLVTSSGCDSLSRLRVTVKPTYFFLTDTTICASERVLYRGKYFSYKDTVYTDSLVSSLGCDSIYQFKLHVRPIFLHTRRVTICDNDTLFHTSLNGQEIVWKPGDEVRNPEWEYYDMVYTDHNGCDSIYRYYITVYPSYLFLDTTVMCSQDSFMLNSNHYVGEKMTYPTETYVAPYQMYYGDTLQTIHGCDSIYGLYATIYPSYHHCDTITICDDGEADWRTHHYEGSMLGNVPGDGLMPGRYVFYDSLLTEHDCDSVYELQLIVTATYLSVDSITKCADDDLTWRSFNLDHVAAGEHFIYDSLFSGHGCDSVYHLYLTVLDTTREDNYDTICYNDTLFVLGHQYRTAGDYKDTATNEMGCHHFIYTHLSVIDPTVPTAWVDSMCKNEDAFDLYYTYTGFDPVTFSLYFDDLGHEMGFEDMIDMPVTEYTDPMVITIPTPLRDGDKKNYPRPDIYGVHLILDNGLCRHPELDCYDDTTFVMSYPSWLTEQRFGDVIALFNEKYNGGYYWDHYQWFHGDELLVGETHEYLYIPTGLIVGDQYHVRLTREGETEDFQTCPITIVGDPINNDFSPQMGYLSVVPTCIVIGHPYANILSRKDGMYRISSSTGHLVSEGVFRADVTQVELPAVAGMYIFQLWSADTPEEPYRSIKVIVKDVCESCNSPF